MPLTGDDLRYLNEVMKVTTDRIDRWGETHHEPLAVFNERVSIGRVLDAADTKTYLERRLRHTEWTHKGGATWDVIAWTVSDGFTAMVTKWLASAQGYWGAHPVSDDDYIVSLSTFEPPMSPIVIKHLNTYWNDYLWALPDPNVPAHSFSIFPPAASTTPRHLANRLVPSKNPGRIR